MKCSEKKILTFINNDCNSQEDYLQCERHIASCPKCAEEYESLKRVDHILASYQNQEIGSDLYYTLRQIPTLTKKKFSLFHLLPHELALTAASIAFALFFGVFSSSQIVSVELADFDYQQDYFEQISLVSLIE